MKKLFILSIFVVLMAGAGCMKTPAPPTTTPEPAPGDDQPVCTAEYNPVCGFVPVQCITAPCYRIPQTFSNQCQANVAGATNSIPGECDPNLKPDDPHVTSPTHQQVVTSPLNISGEAPGTWFFEASFTADVLDANEAVLGTAVLAAEGEWMTTEFVPFQGVATFKKPTGTTGTLLFKKDNPSGLPENDRVYRWPIKF